MLGCSEGHDHEQDRTVGTILAITSIGDTLYFGTHETGVYRFNNKKKSWEPPHADTGLFTLFADETTLYLDSSHDLYRLEPDGKTVTPITPVDLKWSPGFAVDGNTIYVAGDEGQLFRSDNRGNEWHQIPPWPGADAGRYFGTFHRPLVVKGDTIYVTTPQKVFGTVDGGKEWTLITQGLHEQCNVLTLLLSKNTLYLGTDKGLYRHQIGTDSWIPAGLHDSLIDLLVASPTTLYAGTWYGGLFRSYDSGKNWQNIGPFDGTVSTLACFDNRLYVGTLGDGLFYTDDEGATWHPLNKGLNLSPH